MRDAAIPMQVIRHDYSSTNVLNNAWVELDSALNATTSVAEIFDSSGAVLKLAIGAAGAEVELNYYIVPGGAGRVALLLPQGARLAIRSVDTATVSTGQLVINLMR